MAKVMIYVPDELKRQMDDVPEATVNWSQIAQNAFAKRCRGENQSPVSYDDLFRSLQASRLIPRLPCAALTRDIAKAVGVGKSQVSRDLAAPNGTHEALSSPETVPNGTDPICSALCRL